MAPTQAHNNNGRLSKGALISTDNLIAIRHLAKLLPIHKQKKVLNEMAGVHTSNLRGRGVDFSEVRSYQPGDDIRAMDWRVTARTQKPHIKVFREERERPVMVVCDLRSSMFFGTQHGFKSVLAADIVSLFSWSAFNNGDRIGALLFDDSHETDIRPKPGRKQVMHVLHELSQFTQPQGINEPDRHNPTAKTSRLADMLRHTRRVTRPGSTVYFISDWQDFDADCERQLHKISKHNDVVAINIFDAFEQNILPLGSYPLTDGNQRLQLECYSKSQGLEHQQAFERRQQTLKQRTLKLGVPLISLQAKDDIITELRIGLGLSQIAMSKVPASKIAASKGNK
ncbi:MAG: hypothetical protein ACJA10_000100 [Oleispira sp.]|jgi:uncharacterized protein (DUF58 family)